MTADRLRFEDFELDLRTYQMRRSGRILKLERIPMEVLLLLAQRRGQLVTRQEIIEKLWGKNVFLDTDNAINTAIGKSARPSRTIPNNRALSRPSLAEATDLSARFRRLTVLRLWAHTPESAPLSENAGG